MQGRSDSLVFEQVQQIADTRIRENIQRALTHMTIENVDIGLTLLSKEFETTLKRYLLAARLKGKLQSTPNPDPDKWMLANMIECATKHKIIVDRPTLAYLKEVRNDRAHSPTPTLKEREILLKNIQFLVGLYIDYIKLLSDYALQLIPDENMDEEKMEHLSVADYLRIQGCTYKEHGPMSLRSSPSASLEAFICEEVQKAEFADDCAWGVRFGSADSYPSREIDIGLTYRGRLLIVECKSGAVSRTRQGLETLTSTAYLLGGDSVIKVYISDLPDVGFEILQQAKQLGIVVFTAGNFPTIGKLLEEQVKTPTYAKI